MPHSTAKHGAQAMLRQRLLQQQQSNANESAHHTCTTGSPHLHRRAVCDEACPEAQGHSSLWHPWLAGRPASKRQAPAYWQSDTKQGRKQRCRTRGTRRGDGTQVDHFTFGLLNLRARSRRRWACFNESPGAAQACRHVQLPGQQPSPTPMTQEHRSPASAGAGASQNPYIYRPRPAEQATARYAPRATRDRRVPLRALPRVLPQRGERAAPGLST